MVIVVFDESSKDSNVISTMIERDFLVAIERQQRSLAANSSVQKAQRHSAHWLSVLVADWWPGRNA